MDQTSRETRPDSGKNLFFHPDNDVFLELLAHMLKPGESSLAGLFAWYQPDRETVLNFDNLYAEFDSYGIHTVRDLLRDSGLPYSAYKAIANRLKDKTAKIHWETGIDFSGLYEGESAKLEFAELSDRDSLVYRLCVLWVNSYAGDLHNWACESLEFIAHEYADKMHGIRWSPYELNGNSINQDIINILFDSDESVITDRLNVIDSAQFDNSYHYNQTFSRSEEFAELTEYSESLYEETGNRLTERFGYSLDKWDDRDILPIIAESIRQLRIAWNNGDLILTGLPDESSDALREFYHLYSNQDILPGFAELLDQDTSRENRIDEFISGLNLQ